MYLALLFLISAALAASFTPLVSKLDFSALKPKSVLLEELSQSPGIPVDGDVLPWTEQIMAANVPVFKDVARWAMLKYFHEKSEGNDFFHYVMDKFGYASLVKDLVDYGKNDSLLTEYLKKHKLRHFPQLPESLKIAVEQIA